MTDNTPGSRRPYLGKTERKQQLLQAAASLVEARGWSVLNMSSLAEASQVSRQLVYQHFPSLESLLTQTAWAIFSDTMQGTQQAISTHPDNMRQAIHAAALVSLDMPVGRGDALWQMISGMNLGLPELESIRVGIRDVVLGLWVPYLRKERSMPEAQARALVWMLIMSFWGVRNLIRDGVISRKAGLAEFERTIDILL